MKDAITIQLGGYKSPAFKYEVPFWFTVDGQIHMSQKVNPKLTINMEDLVFEHAVEIRSAIIRGELVIDSTEALDKFLEFKLQKPINKTIPKAIPKYNKPEPVVSDLQIKVDQMLTLTLVKLKAKVGNAQITKGVLSKGISEPEILEALLKGEKAKKKNSRKKAIELLNKRFNALAKLNPVIKQSEPMIVEEEEVAEISINTNTGVITTLEIKEGSKEDAEKSTDEETGQDLSNGETIEQKEEIKSEDKNSDKEEDSE